MAGRRKKPSLVLPTPLQEGRSPSVFVLIGAFIAAILIYAIWYGFSASDRTTVTSVLPSATPEMASNATTTTVAAAPSPQTASQGIVIEGQSAQNPPAADAAASAKSATAEQALADTAAAPQAPVKTPHLVIKAVQSSWVFIDDSKGKTVFDRVLKPGETFEVPDKPGLSLTTGNGAGIILTLDGVDLPKLSARSSGTLRDVPLDSAHLKSMTAAKD
jgi:cytoskeleton protein RodZ